VYDEVHSMCVLCKAKQVTLNSLMITLAIYDQKNRIVWLQVNVSKFFQPAKRLYYSLKGFVEEHLQLQH
jgi:hypothetical protein